MQNIINNTKFFILLLPLLLLIGCEGDDNTQYVYGTNSVVNHLEKDDHYSLFMDAIHKAGLYNMLDGNSGSYTVLAPDNTAFETYLSEQSLTDIDAIPEEELLRLVDYHILEILTPKENFVTGYSPTLATVAVNDSVDAHLSLYILKEMDDLEFNAKAEITEADIEVDNGLVHKINSVLTPPTLKTFMDADQNLSGFYEKITANGVTTDFEDLLANPDKRTTILVPNTLAVESFFNEEGAEMNMDQLNQLYRYHLMDTVKLAQNMRTSYLTTKAKEEFTGNGYPLSLYINTDAGLHLNSGTSIAISDLMTINGNIQVLDSVLTIPNLETFVRFDRDLEDFREALTREDVLNQQYLTLLGKDLNDAQAPFTVFAPNGQAFHDLIGEVYGEEASGTLEGIDAPQWMDILNLHLVPSVGLTQWDFTDQSLNTLGDNISLDAANRNLIDPLQKESHIIRGDARASNGVLHYIERVMLPYDIEVEIEEPEEPEE